MSPNGAPGIGESNEIRRTSGPYKVNYSTDNGTDRAIDIFDKTFTDNAHIKYNITITNTFIYEKSFIK